MRLFNREFSWQVFTLVIFLLCYICYYLFQIHQSTGILDPGDGILHYQISRWSWQHPELLLHHWGKPVFTLLSSPFAQFGFKGMQVFNVLVSVINGVFLFMLTKRMGFRLPVLAVPLLLLSPVYFMMVYAGMTEVLFACLLTVGLYYVVTNKLAGPIILSFLPLARGEGFFILPFIGLYFLFQKDIRRTLLLGTGVVLYSIIGGFVFNDFLWVFTHNPYGFGDNTIYGSGDFFHFYLKRYKIFGQWTSNLMLIGFILFGIRLFTNYLGKETHRLRMVLLFILPLAVVFLVHSYFWWHGGYGSAGFIRVIVTVVPLAVIMAIYPFNIKIEQIKWSPKINMSILVLCTILFSSLAYVGVTKHFELPYHSTTYEQVVFRTGDYIDNIERKNKIYYGHPFVAFTANADIFGNSLKELWVLDTGSDDFNTELNDLIVWDTHFWTNEERFELIRYDTNKHFIRLKVFKPQRQLILADGQDWEIHLFERTDSLEEVKTARELDLINDKDSIYCRTKLKAGYNYAGLSVSGLVKSNIDELIMRTENGDVYYRYVPEVDSVVWYVPDQMKAGDEVLIIMRPERRHSQTRDLKVIMNNFTLKELD